jgi:hypothetical protein
MNCYLVIKKRENFNILINDELPHLDFIPGIIKWLADEEFLAQSEEWLNVAFLFFRSMFIFSQFELIKLRFGMQDLDQETVLWEGMLWHVTFENRNEVKPVIGWMCVLPRSLGMRVGLLDQLRSNL